MVVLVTTLLLAVTLGRALVLASVLGPAFPLAASFLIRCVRAQDLNVKYLMGCHFLRGYRYIGVPGLCQHYLKLLGLANSSLILCGTLLAVTDLPGNLLGLGLK